ncbi:MAG: DoxX family protein [Myxococcaceae bacterium]|nr:DoxX family protein [Myxococcaceae bacterium]
MSKSKTIAVWVICVLLAALFAFAGLPKVMGDPRAVEGFAKAGYPGWFLLFIGAAEIAGAIGLLIPRLRFWAASGLFLIMVGAVGTHLRAGDAADKVAPAATALLLTGLIAFWTRPRKLAA